MPGSPVAITRPVDAGRGDRRGGNLLRTRALARLGDPVEMIVVSSVAANCAAIVGGVLVFGDPVGSDALGVIARSAAFAAVVAAAALIPAPRPSAAPKHA